MKHLSKLAIALVVIFAMNACKNSDKPEQVAEKFLKHMEKKEYADAKKLATDESAAAIDQVASFDLGVKATKEAKIEGMACKEEGEKANCTYKKDGADSKIDLVKKDGKWLVDFKKEATTPTEPIDSTKTDTTAKK